MTTYDSFMRPINYLRVSITDRCNLRCVYCMPEEGIAQCSHTEILRHEEVETVVRAAAELGISKVRLTGGEPLVRLGVVELVRALAAIPGIDDLSMTTNGTMLADYADRLVDAGLKRVNISLDTLRPERFRAITRRGDLTDALNGIVAATRAGLTPVKINTVVIPDLNDDEVVDLARKTVEEGWHVRFIEWMPVGEVGLLDRNWRSRVVTAADIRVRVADALGELTPVAGPAGAGPAKSYRLPYASGTVGFITPVSEHFCQHCNRLRLTADGKLRPCLLSDHEIDVRQALRDGAGVSELTVLLKQAILAKPQRHHLNEDARAERRAMAQIGG